MTVRRAVNMLLDQGVVSTVQGRGTFVKGLELGSSTFALYDFQNFFRDKERTKVQLFTTRIVPENEAVANAMAISTGRRLNPGRMLKRASPNPYAFLGVPPRP